MMPPTSRIDRLSDYLQRQARAAKEALRKTLYSAVISAGGLRIIDGGELRMDAEDGTQVFHIGRLVQGGTGYQGIIIRRPDGTSVMYTYPIGGDPSTVGWVLRDRSETTIVSDGRTGTGLARPWIPIPVQTTQFESLPSTSSATFESLMEAWAPRQHDVWVVRVLRTSTASGTTGEVRLRMGSTTIATIPVTFGQQAEYYEIPATGDHMSVGQIVLEGRRTAGTGRIAASLLGWGRGA